MKSGIKTILLLYVYLRPLLVIFVYNRDLNLGSVNYIYVNCHPTKSKLYIYDHYRDLWV